jgi:hypothetical protein
VAKIIIKPSGEKTTAAKSRNKEPSPPKIKPPKQKGIIGQMLEIIYNDLQKKKREITGEDIMDSGETWMDWEDQV